MWSSVFYIINWVLGASFFPKPLTLFDEIFYYAVSSFLRGPAGPEGWFADPRRLRQFSHYPSSSLSSTTFHAIAPISTKFISAVRHIAGQSISCFQCESNPASPQHFHLPLSNPIIAPYSPHYANMQIASFAVSITTSFLSTAVELRTFLARYTSAQLCRPLPCLGCSLIGSLRWLVLPSSLSCKP